jgi:CheY-like chemotaxis protein
VTVAPDGRAALERFRAEAPTLVILDLMLPDVSSVGLVATSGTITTSRHRVWHGGLQGMVDRLDRLDALSRAVRVESRPGEGTGVRGDPGARRGRGPS